MYVYVCASYKKWHFTCMYEISMEVITREFIIRKSVDSLCRDGTDTPIT